MKMNQLSTAALLATTLALCSSPAHAGVRFAQGEVNLQGTVSIAETNRVSPRATSTSDTIYSFTPAIMYSRDSARLKLDANLSLPMSRYDRNDRLDSNSVVFDLSGNVPYGSGPRLSSSWSVAYFDGVRSDYISNRNVSSENFNAGLNANYRLINNLGIRSSLSYSDRTSGGIDTAFQNANETTAFSLGLHARELLGRVGAYVTYRIQDRKTTRGLINDQVDAKDDGINFGFTGQILPERLFPKLDADLSFGFASTETSRTQTGGRSNRLTLDGSLRYPANARTDVALTFNRNLLVTDDDRTVERSQVNLILQYRPRPKLSLNTSVGAQSNDFLGEGEDRNDDIVTFLVGARYLIRPHWSTSLNYNLRDASSNNAISDFSSSRVTLSTTLSY